jgi:predicted peptidase
MFSFLVVSLTAIVGCNAHKDHKQSVAEEHAALTPEISELQSGQDVEFKALFDDSIQKYIIRLPKGFKPNTVYDLLIAFHGHGSDRHQFVEGLLSECKAARDVAAKHNMLFVSPDYRAPTSWMCAAAEADTVQLIFMLKKQYKISRVFLTGASMGGTAVLTFAALHPRLVDGVCSLNGIANLLEYDVNYLV